MRRILLALGALASAAAWHPVAADCSQEVADAVKQQTTAKAFRKTASMITTNGPAKMTIEVIAPDRMRQVVTLLANPKPVESILIGGKAWSNAGGGWKKLEAQATGELFTFFQSITGSKAQLVGAFKCLGTEPIDGRTLRAYQGIEDTSKKPPIGGKGTNSKNEAERFVFVDPDTGRLIRTVYAQKGKRERPIFSETFSYPEDLKIEQPDVN